MIHHQNAKWIARTLLSFALWMTCLPGRASDVPGQNGQGEFVFGKRREWVTTWRVMDRTGLNCRMAERFMGTTYADAGAPDSLYANFTHEIGSWPVVAEFGYQENLNARTANLRNPNILYDRRGKAWMAVETTSPRYDHLMCFVRANSNYILPVSKD